MDRLNLTLDSGTSVALTRHARRAGRPRAAIARELIQEALARREAVEQRQKLARDYAAGRQDARELLEDLEAAQRELLEDE